MGGRPDALRRARRRGGARRGCRARLARECGRASAERACARRARRRTRSSRGDRPRRRARRDGLFEPLLVRRGLGRADVRDAAPRAAPLHDGRDAGADPPRPGLLRPRRLARPARGGVRRLLRRGRADAARARVARTVARGRVDAGAHGHGRGRLRPFVHGALLARARAAHSPPRRRARGGRARPRHRRAAGSAHGLGRLCRRAASRAARLDGARRRDGRDLPRLPLRRGAAVPERGGIHPRLPPRRGGAGDGPRASRRRVARCAAARRRRLLRDGRAPFAFKLCAGRACPPLCGRAVRCCAVGPLLRLSRRCGERHRPPVGPERQRRLPR